MKKSKPFAPGAIATILLSLLSLLPNSRGYSQSVTQIALPDTQVLISKQLVVWMLQDLAQCDGDREELNLLRERDSLHTDVIERQTAIIKKVTQQYKDVKASSDSCYDAKGMMEVDLHLSQKKVTKITRQRNYLMAGLAAVVGLLFVK